MKVLVLDVETTIHENGDGFSKYNKLCVVGLLTSNQETRIYDIEYSQLPYGDKLKEIQEIVDGHDLIVGVNLKFDLHWLRRYGINFDKHNRVFDCQLCEFLLLHQTAPYPSLNSICSRLGLGSKLDTIATEYWDKDINTTDIPYGELVDYLVQDLRLTQEAYLKQSEELEKQPKLKRLFNLQCQDLMVLEEMEYNGLLFDEAKAKELSAECEASLAAKSEELTRIFGSDKLNLNSNEHLSAALYGGSAKVKEKEDYLFKYKDGRISPKKRNVVKEYVFHQLVRPLKGTALQKEGYYSTSEDVLRQLRPTNAKGRRAIELILEHSKLEKLNGTYYKGLSNKIEKKGWENNYLHGNLNQCVARTGRLSSSDPNLQNVAEEVLECIVTRYAD